MTLGEFSTRIRFFIEDLNASREEESVLIGQELTAQIRNRVQNQKLNADGSPFGQYSTAKVPQWFFYNKALSLGADKKLKTGPWFTSYAEFRDNNNLNTGDINFTFSGLMWKNTGVTEVKTEGQQTTVTIGGQTDRAAKIQEYQAPRYGNIIEANETEINNTQKAHEMRINNKLKKYFQ